MMTADDLKEVRYSLAHLSEPAVLEGSTNERTVPVALSIATRSPQLARSKNSSRHGSN
jgi:hypothetical protein